MFGVILKRDREREGMTQTQAARKLGVSVAEYRAVEAGKQAASLGLYERTVALFGWPVAYVAPAGAVRYRLRVE